MTRRRVLAIAGSDSGGGAGIQADIKAVAAMGAYATTAVTAVTAQDTVAVHAVHDVPPAMVCRQIEAVLDDIGTDAIKTGMLGGAATVRAVADLLAARLGDDGPLAGVPLVVDPVMRSKGGAALLADDAREMLCRRLLPLTTVLTPNLPEAEALAGVAIRDAADGARAARALLGLGVRAVLLKGGHASGDTVVDRLFTPDGAVREWRGERLATRHTHGTGCTLASALAAGLAQGLALPDAVGRAHAYVRRAIAAAPGFGRGAGPLDHLLGAAAEAGAGAR